MNKFSIFELLIHLFANQLKFKYLVNNFSRILYSVSVFFLFPTFSEVQIIGKFQNYFSHSSFTKSVTTSLLQWSLLCNMLTQAGGKEVDTFSKSNSQLQSTIIVIQYTYHTGVGQALRFPFVYANQLSRLPANVANIHFFISLCIIWNYATFKTELQKLYCILAKNESAKYFKYVPPYQRDKKYWNFL